MITIDNIKKDCTQVLKHCDPDLRHTKALHIIAKSLGYNSFRKMKNAYLIDEITGEMKSLVKNYPLKLSQCDVSKGFVFNKDVLKNELKISNKEALQIKHVLEQIKK